MDFRRIWLGALVLLLAPAAHYWISYPTPALHEIATPIDGTSPAAAPLWDFLEHARDFVPNRATYTVTASTRDDEMLLYMMSLGLLGHAQGLPSSYYSKEFTHVGGTAEYVLAFGCGRSRGDGQLLTYAPGGCVFRRAR